MKIIRNVGFNATQQQLSTSIHLNVSIVRATFIYILTTKLACSALKIAHLAKSRTILLMDVILIRIIKDSQIITKANRTTIIRANQSIIAAHKPTIVMDNNIIPAAISLSNKTILFKTLLKMDRMAKMDKAVKMDKMERSKRNGQNG